VKEITGGVDEPSDFLRVEHDRQSPGRFGIWNVFRQKMAPQCLDEEEA
jgi:hypothetical protein